MISEPGIYAIPAAEYHGDPVVEPSLSASIATILIQQSPLHAKWAHPRLVDCPTFEVASHLDTGTICHALMLEGENVAHVITAKDKEGNIVSDYRTKAAQTERDEARAAGKFPILADEMAEVDGMIAACRQQLAGHQTMAVRHHAFNPTNGKPEQTLVWKEVNGVWCRCRIDWLATERALMFDYKTSGRSAHPQNISRIAASNGWCLQASFYRRGFKAVFGADLDPSFYFVCQETYRPYALTVFELSPGDMALADAQVEYAIDTFGECLKSGIWPGYSNRVERITSPPYVESAWLERELEER